MRGAQSPAVAVRSAELPALATAWGGRGRRTRGTRPPSVVSAVRLPRGDTHSKSRRGRDFTAWLLAAGALQEPRSPAGPGLAARGGGCPAVPRQQLRRKFLAVRGMQPLLLPPTLGCVACVLFCAPPLPPLGNIHIIIISIFFSVAAFTGIACPTAGRGVRTMQSGPSLPGPRGCISLWLGLLKKGLPHEVSRWKWRQYKAETMGTKLHFLFVQTLPAK